jgi:type IV secretory pathway VirB10-like protein
MSNYDDRNRNGVTTIDPEEPIRPATGSEPDSADSTSASVEEVANQHPASFATRASVVQAEGISKGKLLLLGGGLAIAVLFFVFTAIVGKSAKKHQPSKPLQQSKQTETKPSKGSLTPLMETVRSPTQDNDNGQIGPGDIRRTRTEDGTSHSATATASVKQVNSSAKPLAGTTLASVPSFADTQQRWEEPRPYGEPASTVSPIPPNSSQNPQQSNVLKEASLIFVRTPVQSQPAQSVHSLSELETSPLLDVKPGTRIQAKLETQISSAVQAPVVAVVEYTYAIGDKVVLPAGARVYGQLQQADRSGVISIKFDEVELLDGNREKIDAIGTGLDLGPIRGKVSGTNAGRNFMVRAASGVGSLLAQVAGTNSSAAFSEQDILRQRVAENIGTAGDTEIMNLNSNSRVVVSVPADTKIFIVFTKHDEQSSSSLHKVPQ